MSQLFKLKNGTVLLSTEAPGGVYNSGQLKKIAELCSKELAVVKATEDQRLALFVKESEVEKVVAQLQIMGLGVRSYQDGLHQPIACLGELCEQHEQPALASAMDLTKAIAEIALKSSLKIGINGCARCCTPCHTFDISILGEPSGYRISLGGKNSQFPELSSFFAEGVPPKELPRLIKSVIVLFQKHAEAGETLHSVLERCGVEEFVKALAPYSQDAAQRDDPFAAKSEEGTVDQEAESENEISSPDDINLEEDFSLAEEDASGLDDINLEESDLIMEEAPEGAPEPMSDHVDLDLGDESFSLEVDAPDALEEIPIEGNSGSMLGDDISLKDDDVGLGDELLLEDDSFTDDQDLNLEAAGLDDGLGEAPPVAVSLNEAPLKEEPACSPAELKDDVMELDESALSYEEIPEAELDSLNLSDSPAEKIEAEISMEFEELEPEAIVATAPVPEEALLEADDFGEIDEIDDSAELDPSVKLEADLELLEEGDAISFEDDEGIPDLDGGLDPESLQVSIPLPTPAPVEKQIAISKAEDTFEEELDLESVNLSDEEESHFEAKLQASIEEESRLLADVPSDPNESDRQAALHLLENNDSDDLVPKVNLKAKAKAPTPSLARVGRGAPQDGFHFAGLSFEGSVMRLAFTSGAYVDVDLGALSPGEEKIIKLGGLQFKVEQVNDGFTVELDGLRMFYPSSSLRSVS